MPSLSTVPGAPVSPSPKKEKKPTPKKPNGKERKETKKEARSESLKTPTPKNREVIFPKYDVQLFDKENLLDFKLAKDLLGWITEPEFVKQAEALNEGKASKKSSFGTGYTCTDRLGEKVRCTHNLHNRPFTVSVAQDWMLEILNQKWRMNGETIIIDKYGDIQDGQHRLIGLVWAVQEWEADCKKPLEERRWAAWEEAPAIEALVFCGIEADDDTVNTIGVGKPRSLEDALYRCEWFAKLPEGQRQATAKTARYAVRFLQWRTAQDQSFVAKRSHSEAFDFIQRHAKILDCVKFVHNEDDKGSISKLLPLGYAAALMYLMGSAGSEDEEYRKVNNETCLNWDLSDKAEEFWVEFGADKSPKLEALRLALLGSDDAEGEEDGEELAGFNVSTAGGSFGRDWKCGMTIKAWNAYSDGDKVTAKNIAIGYTLNGDGQPTLTETPSLGGIDIVYSAAE